jgi:hypothetical protein
MGNSSALIEAVRDKAAEIGCDGVIVRPGTGFSYEGTCVVYK